MSITSFGDSSLSILIPPVRWKIEVHQPKTTLITCTSAWSHQRWRSPTRLAEPPTGAVPTSALGCAISDGSRSEEHTSELQSRFDLVCRLLLEKKKNLDP